VAEFTAQLQLQEATCLVAMREYEAGQRTLDEMSQGPFAEAMGEAIVALRAKIQRRPAAGGPEAAGVPHPAGRGGSRK
jgi:hypothetical protein